MPDNNTNPNPNTNPNINQIEAPPTSFIPYTAFNTTLTQGLNPGDYYGMQEGQTCNLQGCVPNVITQEKYLIPSFEQIAEYNRESLYNSNAQNTPITNNNMMPQNTQSSASQTGINQMPMEQNVMGTSENQTGIPQTPATTFNYGATLSSSAQMSAGITDFQNPYPVTPESLQYLNGFLRTQIGRRVSIDFLVGSNTIVTKLGYLLGVASNYILINELDTNDITTCDFYNIKFIRFYY